jgi:hypothetical protein
LNWAGAWYGIGTEDFAQAVDEFVLSRIALQLKLQLTVLYNDECRCALDIAEGAEEACFSGPCFDPEEYRFLYEKTRYLKL